MSLTRENRSALFEHLDKLGFYDALIRGDKAQTVDARCSDDRAVGGISQSTQRGDLEGHFVSQGQDAKDGVGVQALKELLDRDCQRGLWSACQEGDFEEADGAEGDGFASADRQLKRAPLCPRELPGFKQPANEDVSLQQQARLQEGLLFRSGSVFGKRHFSRRPGTHRSNPLAKASSNYFATRKAAAVRRFVGVRQANNTFHVCHVSPRPLLGLPGLRSAERTVQMMTQTKPLRKL